MKQQQAVSFKIVVFTPLNLSRNTLLDSKKNLSKPKGGKSGGSSEFDEGSKLFMGLFPVRYGLVDYLVAE